MKIDLNELTGNDINLYFHNTYVRLCQNGKKPRWCFWKGPVPGGYVIHDGEENQTIGKGELKGAFIDVQYPYGYFNVDLTKTVFYAERIAQRQNLKGLCPGTNYQISWMEQVLNGWGVFKNAPEKPALRIMLQDFNNKNKINSKVLQAAFEKPEYTEPQAAYVAIMDHNYFARAVNQDFAITLDAKSDNLLVLYHYVPVGEMVGKKSIKTTIPAYKQELTDFFVPKGIQVT